MSPTTKSTVSTSRPTKNSSANMPAREAFPPTASRKSAKPSTPPPPKLSRISVIRKGCASPAQPPPSESFLECQNTAQITQLQITQLLNFPITQFLPSSQTRSSPS